MKKLILAAAVLFFCSGAFSQKIFFAYLQTDNGRPFFVRMNDRVYSSSATGYVILSRLRDSTYTVFVGFPGETGEQKFTITIPHKDKGYLLKNLGSEGWGLFDLQALTMQKALNATTKVTTVPDENVSPFTEILSKAADDPSLKEKTVAEVARKAEPIIPTVQKEELATPVSNEAAVKEPVPEKIVPANIRQASENITAKNERNDSASAEPKKLTEPQPANSVEKQPENKTTYKPSEVVRVAESEGSEGRELTYVDRQSSGNVDTIRIQIDKPVVLVKQDEPAKEEKKFLDIAVQPNTDSTQQKTVQEGSNANTSPSNPVKEAVKEETKQEEAAPVVSKAEPCKSEAGESDFIKLRRKMVAADDDDAMVMEARKGFREKCFTVYQIRNLSALFLSDEGKYKLFDAAYPYASDAHNFISLKLELKEGYWVKRFEAMLR